MEIKVKSYSWSNDVTVIVECDNVKLNEEMSKKEASELAVSFLEDTLLENCWQSEVIGKLIEARIITHEQILEYVEESGEE